MSNNTNKNNVNVIVNGRAVGDIIFRNNTTKDIQKESEFQIAFIREVSAEALEKVKQDPVFKSYRFETARRNKEIIVNYRDSVNLEYANGSTEDNLEQFRADLLTAFFKFFMTIFEEINKALVEDALAEIEFMHRIPDIQEITQRFQKQDWGTQWTERLPSYWQQNRSSVDEIMSIIKMTPVSELIECLPPLLKKQKGPGKATNVLIAESENSPVKDSVPNGENGECVPENELEEIVVLGKKIEKVDYKGVIPTKQLRENNDLYSFFRLAIENSVWRNVMKDFYKNQSNVYVHLGQLKEDGIPVGRSNIARTESYMSSKNPVGKYGQSRIIINSDILNNMEELDGDHTFVFMALLHEGLHAKMYDTYKNNPTFSDYPGYKDFVLNRQSDGGHHNQMGAFNRQTLIDGMKEFDKQTGMSHTEDWYKAMSWTGLLETKAWNNFKKNNSKEAELYKNLIDQEIKKLGGKK